MKRFICAIFACIFIMTSLPVLAEDKCTVSVDDVKAMSNGTVLVTMKIENNPGMAIGKVTLGFDKEKLLPISVDKSDILQNAYSFTSNVDDPSVDASELDFVTVSWMNMSNITGDGILAVVEFAVKENVSGSTDISVEISEMANALQNNIDTATVNGTITFDDGSGDDGDDNNDIVLGFSNTTITKTENRIGGDVNLSVYSPQPISAAFICTIYDRNGLLLAVKNKNQALKLGINEVGLGEITAAADENSSYIVKVFMWNSLEGMKQLTDEPIMKKY